VCDPHRVALVERVRVIAWLNSEDARRYTEVGPLVAKAIEENRHQGGDSTVRLGDAPECGIVFASGTESFTCTRERGHHRHEHRSRRAK
jgi:hypothetical protein